MSTPVKDFARRLKAVEMSARVTNAATQLSNSTAGDTEDTSVDVVSVVVEAAVTNDAVPDLQDDVGDQDDATTDLQLRLVDSEEDLDARFADAAQDLADAREDIEEAQGAINDAFGVRFDGMSEDIQTAITAAGNAQSTADGIPLILFSTTRGPSNNADLAPTGSTWFLINEANNIAGQWQQTGPPATPTWTPRAIVSDVIANLDVGKLTAGQAAIATLVAQKIAASTASFQTVNVANLFVTSGATMNQATIDYLFANVVQAKKITASMIDVATLNGVTITGAILQTSASGKRVVLANNVLTFWGLNGSNAVAAGVIEGVPNGADRGMIQIRSSTDGTVSMLFGNVALPVSGSVNAYGDTAWVQDMYVTRLWDAGTGLLIGGSGAGPTTIPVASGYVGSGATAVKSGSQAYLQGQIATSGGGALASSAANIGTMPAPFQPSQPQIFLVAGAGGFIARVQIATNGVISYSVIAGSSSYLRLDAISYRLS